MKIKTEKFSHASLVGPTGALSLSLAVRETRLGNGADRRRRATASARAPAASSAHSESGGLAARGEEGPAGSERSGGEATERGQPVPVASSRVAGAKDCAQASMVRGRRRRWRDAEGSWLRLTGRSPHARCPRRSPTAMEKTMRS